MEGPPLTCWPWYVPRQVRRETRRFQVNPSVMLGPFLPSPPLRTTRGIFSGPALPPGFIRAPQTQTQADTIPRLTYTPPTPAGPSSPNFQSTSSSGAQASQGQGPVAATTRREVGFDSPSKSSGAGSGSGGAMSLTPVMKQQGEVESLGLNFSSAQYQMLSDQRRLPSKNPADAAAQRHRLTTYSSLLIPIQEQYGDLQSPRARATISLVFGMHKSNIP
mmetsp:Transcript_2731/g.6621  ORF Transcript_2731/g.6621 Transcript_2731/m.6621 type:complete len:219 (-) Transcript_2731:59-715(-)